MNKMIILILGTFFLIINCEGYTSSELSFTLNYVYNINNINLLDIDSVLNSEWQRKFKKILEDLTSEDNRDPYLIIVNELNYSNLGQEEFFSDFVERFIPTTERKKIAFILLYCISDDRLFCYAGEKTNIETKDVNKYYNENKGKYDNYQEILYQTLEDINDKLVKNALVALAIVLSIIVVAVVVGIIIYCCYCKKKKKGKVKANDNNNNNNIVYNNQNQFGVPQSEKQINAQGNLQNQPVYMQPNQNMNFQNQPVYMQPNQNMIGYNAQTPIAYNQINNQQIPMNQNYNSNPGSNNVQNVGYSSHNY